MGVGGAVQNERRGLGSFFFAQVTARSTVHLFNSPKPHPQSIQLSLPIVFSGLGFRGCMGFPQSQTHRCWALKGLRLRGYLYNSLKALSLK